VLVVADFVPWRCEGVFIALFCSLSDGIMGCSWEDMA